MTELSKALWNDDVSPSDFTEDKREYQTAVLEQYKLCVEMADRVSARRNLCNTFFLSLNSAIAAGLVIGLTPMLASASAWLAAAALLIVLAQCAAWFVIVRSYRLLNAAKYAVIGTLEERLPALAYSGAEWGALGEGKDWRKYLPVTHIEQWVPGIFAAAYVVGFVAILL